MFAISADAPANARVTREETGVRYPLLTDANLKLATDIGIAYQNPGKPALPVPSIFVVAKGGRIVYEHVDPDFSVRLDNDIILAMARTVK